MLLTLLSYFIILFIVARLISLSSYINWMPTIKTTIKHDVIVALAFSLFFSFTMG